MKITAAFAVAAVLLLSGCATLTPQEIAAANFGPCPAEYQGFIQNYMQGILKDPNSATYRFGTPRKGFVQDGLAGGNKKHFGYIVQAEINAKNSYGGYAGESTYYFILFQNDGEEQIADITHKFTDSLLHMASYIEQSPNEDCTAKTIATPAPSQSSGQGTADVQPDAKEIGLIKKFTGSDATTTRPFTVPDKWEIQWDAQGQIFQIYLKDGQGKLLGIAANQSGPGKGSAYQPKGGEYILQVNAMGPWTIKAVRVEN